MIIYKVKVPHKYSSYFAQYEQILRGTQYKLKFSFYRHSVEFIGVRVAFSRSDKLLSLVHYRVKETCKLEKLIPYVIQYLTDYYFDDFQR